MARLLVVEDDEDVRDVLVELLEEAGHDVAATRNGKEALDAHPESFDLILADLRMPVLNGQDLKRELDDRLIDAPVIVVSADWNVARIAAHIGAFCALHKPIDLLELMAAVNRALSRETSPEAH